MTPIPPPTQESTDHLECLYFSNSAFFRHPSGIDGAVVVDGDAAMFFLNDYGQRLHRVRQTALHAFFSRHGAMSDVSGFEKRGFLIADCDIDRANEGAVLRFVAKKYHLNNPRLMDFQRFSTFASTRGNKDPGSTPDI